MSDMLPPTTAKTRCFFRRAFALLLFSSLVLVGCDSQGGDDPGPEPGPSVLPDPLSITLSGEIQDVHDPVLVEDNGFYYTFSTGGGIQMRYSQNFSDWRYGGDVLGGVPAWAQQAIPGVQELWAPDVARFNGRWHLYYSASTFGSGRSAIGLATAPQLSTNGTDWTDQEMVIESYNRDSFNAIDPNIVVDDAGQPWMAFGSYNETGIRMRQIDPETGKLSSEDETLYQLAQRPDNGNSVEAPFVVNHGDYYYLFVSWGSCCPNEDEGRPLDSITYNVRVGRSESVTGPYIGQDGVGMNEGGGTLVVEGGRRWIGTGHNGYFEGDDGESYLVYHAYDANSNGTPTLRISPIDWEDGWPTVEGGVRPE